MLLPRSSSALPGSSASEIDALVVGVGPGSFTSIRIGLATARGLGLALGIPAAGVSTFLAFDGGLPVIDAKRGQVLHRRGRAVGPPEELEVDGLRLVGDGAVRYRELFEAAGAEVPPDDDPAHLPAARLLAAHAAAFGPAEAIEPALRPRPRRRPRPMTALAIEIRPLGLSDLNAIDVDRAARLPDPVVALDVRVGARQGELDLPRRATRATAWSATSSTLATSTHGT